MARELNQLASDLKKDPETSFCMANIPNLYLDIHNACVMHKMRTYIILVEGPRHRHCSYSRKMWKLGVTVRQLYFIMSQKCHGVLSDREGVGVHNL
ncbi:hypothetical protein LDENG_00195710 [Lucifuga dentata]|nr:hypothetical protein LDENG_00195710 [Lucifuga dentata]